MRSTARSIAGWSRSRSHRLPDPDSAPSNRAPASRPVRNNITHAILFQNYNNQELQLLQKELGSDLPKGEFRKLYNYILSKKYNFMVIDNETDDKRKRYRNQFDGLYEGKLNNYNANFFKPDNYADESEEESD